MEEERGQSKPYSKGDGNLPVLSVKGRTIPEAWENSVVELHKNGLWYNRGGRKDKGNLQVDSTMVMEIEEPNSGLFMHKYSVCGWDDLFEYQMEILGAKDSWVDKTGKSTRWGYHYHERLADYPGINTPSINQLEGIIKKLAKKPTTRQLNAITWVPERDEESIDPPCLQRVWFGLVPDETTKDEWRLNMNYNFRSRNVMIAAPMNQSGLALLQEYVRQRAIEETGMKIKNGRMVDFVDSYHVSAKDQQHLAKFMSSLTKSREKGESIESRSFSREMVNTMMEDSLSTAEAKIIAETEKLVPKERLDEEIAHIKSIRQLVYNLNAGLADSE